MQNIEYKNLVKKNLGTLIASAVLVVGILVGFSIFVNAQIKNVVFPVSQLGNCTDKNECKTYCDNPENAEACTDFALEHNLISEKESRRAKKFVRLETGPGGCNGMEQCENYCADLNNIDECLSFAERNNFMDDEELVDARKVARALKGGAQLPGGCQNHQACESYCHEPQNMDECLVFAEKAGLMNSEELQEAKKIATALKRGLKHPGDCRGKDECESYCRAPENINECLDFAQRAGLMDEKEAEEARKIGPLMARGEMPGGCKSKQTCEAYCGNEEHTQECMEFATKAGLASPEEIERFKATGGKGPGGCRGREECEAFCNNSDNQGACFSFAKEHKLIGQEELEHIEKNSKEIREGSDNFSQEVLVCLGDKLGLETVQKIQSGALTPSPRIGEAMQKCFQEFNPQTQEREHVDNGEPRDFPQNEVFDKDIPEEFLNEVHKLPDDIRRPAEEGVDFERIQRDINDFRPQTPEILNEYYPEKQESLNIEHPQEFQEPTFQEPTFQEPDFSQPSTSDSFSEPNEGSTI